MNCYLMKWISCQLGLYFKYNDPEQDLYKQRWDAYVEYCTFETEESKMYRLNLK